MPKLTKFCWFCSLSLLLILSACEEFVPSFEDQVVTGYRPIYNTSGNVVAMTEARAIDNAGQIYVYSSYVLIEERGNGFHILDNTDPTDPKPTGFMSIPNNTQISIQANIIYANSGSSLLAIAIQSDGSLIVNSLDDVLELDRVRIVPPEADFYFECVDPSKGTLIGWTKEKIENPQCYY